MENKNTFSIGNLDEESMRVLTNALELYIRLSTGELDEIDRVMVWEFEYSNANQDEKKALLNQLKNLYAPALVKGGYYSIVSPKISERAKLIYDLYYSIRHNLDTTSPLGKTSAYRAEPLNIANKPLPSITKE